MKKISVLLFVLMLGLRVFAQDAKVISIINFTGLVDKYPIEMRLEIDQQSDSVSGEYHYAKNKGNDRIILEGILKDGVLHLSESTYSVKKRQYEKKGKFQLNYVNQTSLNGSWQKNVEGATYLSFILNARENLKAFNPASYVFQYARNKASLDYIPADAQYYYHLLSLKIYVNKSMRWAFADFDDVFMREATIELQDLNFDGYLDFKVPIYYPGLAKGDYAYRYFIYNPKTLGFKQDKTLNEIGVAFFDSAKKEVSAMDADGRGNEGTKYYRWQNGGLFLIKEERVYEDDTYTHLTYYKIENGKSVKLRTEKRK